MSRRGVLAAVLGGVVVMAALVVAALGKPLPLLSRPAQSESVTRLPTLSTSTVESTPSSPSTSAAATPLEPSPFLVVLVQLVLAFTVIVLLVMVVQLLRSLLRKPHVTKHEEPDFAIPLVPTELLETARSRLLDLETGEPRNAIVAAWLGLESSASATGLPRLPAETSSEYTARVLGVWPVDAERLADLAALFREARFSVHPLGEPERRRAVGDLRVLVDGLERVAAQQAARRAAQEPTGSSGSNGSNGSNDRGTRP
ncbi:DUF4129 domain-containing protein [Terrabacter sp. NPDC000476]|uniref:DUF4129 domain-containing protein n=1 Tax=Terrabacter sp. NPDC000476 TaxID=3154258 RepID=UPI0033186FBC